MRYCVYGALLCIVDTYRIDRKAWAYARADFELERHKFVTLHQFCINI